MFAEVLGVAAMGVAAADKADERPLPDVRVAFEGQPPIPEDARLAPPPMASGMAMNAGFVGQPPQAPVDPPPRPPSFINKA